MRPGDKGPDPGPFTSYGQAQPHLLQRLGDYCSYWERQIETNLAVEHVQPESLEPELELKWVNFLLGCINCNSSKGDSKVKLDDHVWPDIDNTLLLFDYDSRGMVRVAAGLAAAEAARVEALVRLVGLDKDPGNPDSSRRPTERDKRWLRRFEAWRRARRYRRELQANDSVELRRAIVDVATLGGMFSIWFHFFRDDPDMRRRLIEAFPGTAPDAFDADHNPVARPVS